MLPDCMWEESYALAAGSGLLERTVSLEELLKGVSDGGVWLCGHAWLEPSDLKELKSYHGERLLLTPFARDSGGDLFAFAAQGDGRVIRCFHDDYSGEVVAGSFAGFLVRQMFGYLSENNFHEEGMAGDSWMISAKQAEYLVNYWNDRLTETLGDEAMDRVTAVQKSGMQKIVVPSPGKNMEYLAFLSPAEATNLGNEYDDCDSIEEEIVWLDG